MRLAFDPSARRLEGGRVLLGGQPTRRLRFTEAGARLVDSWRAGAPVGEGEGARLLAARLIDAGLAHPRPALGTISLDEVAVVIPTRDRASALAACLARVGPCGEIVVVDDGSLDAAALAAAARRGAGAAVAPRCAAASGGAARSLRGPATSCSTPHPPGEAGAADPSEAAWHEAAGHVGVRVVRRAVSGGPAAARNTGLAATSAPFVAFLDSDTLPVAGWLEPLLAHFADPRVAAVAPRVRVPAGTSALAAYEAVRSPLDLGPHPGVVGPGRRIGYVPAAALVVRRAAAPMFDEAMRFGEDVDLVWRLAAAGWVVRYEPAGVVEHPHRSTLRAWLAQRAAYGSSAGPLARRHPGQMRHVVVPRSALLPWALALAGKPRLALVSTAIETVWAISAPRASSAPPPSPRAAAAAPLPPSPRATAPRELLVLGLEARARTARQIADAAWRAHTPLLLPTRRGRRILAAALLAGTAVDWLAHRPKLDPLRFGALRAADDLAYASGVWAGCARARTLAPLLPQISVHGKYPKLDRE